MNANKAAQEGLRFTGSYERSYKKDLIKARALEIRKLGFRAVVVDADGGYSVYADEYYFLDRQLTELEARVSYHDDRVARIQAEYETKMAQEQECQETYLRSITVIHARLAENKSQEK